MTGLAKFLESKFQGREVYILGGGPSLLGFDFSLLDGLPVIAVNHSYEYCTPDLIVYLDNDFLKQLSRKGHRFDQLPAPVLKDTRGTAPGECYQVNPAQRPEDNSEDALFSKVSSGAMALSAALFGGASHVYLLGYDCHGEGLIHFYDEDWESRGLKHGAVSRRYENMIKTFETFGPRFSERVTNLSPDSKIEAFKKKDWREHPWPQSHEQKRAV